MAKAVKPQSPTVSDKALTVLLSVFAGEHLKAALHRCLADDDPEAALVSELSYGVCRYYFALTRLIDRLIPRPLPKKHNDLRLLLCMGLYQLQHTRRKAYAVVNETVKLTKIFQKSWANGLINACLRRFIREQAAIEHELVADPIYRSALPPWLLERLRRQGLANQSQLRVYLRKPPLHIRLNLTQVSVEHYQQLLADQGVTAYVHPQLMSALTIVDKVDPTSLPGFQQGWYMVQDHGAQWATTLLDIGPKQRILDACCAPGGKLLQLAEQLDDTSTLLAIDNNAKRMLQVEENLARLRFERVTLTVADAAAPESWWDGQGFDRILLDAPCSATGVISRYPDIKIHRTVGEVDEIVALQQRLLSAMVSVLKPGGLLLYVTCSILDQENSEQVAWLLQTHAGRVGLVDTHVCQPWLNQAGGYFYYALFRTQAISADA